MKKLLLCFTLVLTVCNMAMADGQTATPPNTEIWYTTSDGKAIELNYETVFGATYKSNEYKDGKGIVTFEGDVTTIGQVAFFYCQSLASITLPESLESIGHMAFQGVDMKSVFVKWTAADEIPDLEENQFPYYQCDLYIPYGTKKIYGEKEFWKSFRSIIEPHLHIVNTDNTEEDRYMKDGDVLTLSDDIMQIVTKGTVEDIDLTYTRDFTRSAGNWQCWFVPFDAPLEILKESGFDAAEIAGILLNEKGETIVAFKKMTVGTLKANTPYVVRIGKNVENKHVNLEFNGSSLKATDETVESPKKG